jgi:hypothetical protein
MKRIVLALFALAALAIFSSSAQAGHWHGHFGHYHGPSLHYHKVYHPTTLHWTPYRGWHTHGHYHVVPHYTPGHFHW